MTSRDGGKGADYVGRACLMGRGGRVWMGKLMWCDARREEEGAGGREGQLVDGGGVAELGETDGLYGEIVFVRDGWLYSE